MVYYDCTNFYFETEQAENDKQYSVSKENRPLPIVEMGLFMDSDDIPIAFGISPRNDNEQDGCRSFIATQSIKKLKSHLKNWALDPQVWHLSGDLSGRIYDIRELDDKNDKDKIFFKSHWIKKKSVIAWGKIYHYTDHLHPAGNGLRQI